MLGLFLAFLIEAAGSLPLHWLGLIPGSWLGGVMGEIMLVVISIFRLVLAYLAGFVAGTRINFKVNHTVPALNGYAFQVAVVALIASFAIYIYGYLTFQSRVQSALREIGYSSAVIAPAIDDYLSNASGGFKGVVGYFIASAQGGTTLGIFDETLVLEPSRISTWINWIIRIVVAVLTFVLARKGTIDGIVEKANSIKENRPVSMEKAWEYIFKILESHN
jgi:hypothetical protein